MEIPIICQTRELPDPYALAHDDELVLIASPREEAPL